MALTDISPGVLAALKAAPPPKIDQEPQESASRGMKLTGLEARTRLSTSFGDVPAQLLRRNDPVRTLDGKFVRVVNVNAIRLDRDFLNYHRDATPVRILKDAFGPGRPAKDIVVAPDQPVGLGNGGADKRFRLARDLVGVPKVQRMFADGATYYQIKLEEPATVLCEKVALYFS